MFGTVTVHMQDGEEFSSEWAKVEADGWWLTVTSLDDKNNKTVSFLFPREQVYQVEVVHPGEHCK